MSVRGHLGVQDASFTAIKAVETHNAGLCMTTAAAGPACWFGCPHRIGHIV